MTTESMATNSKRRREMPKSNREFRPAFMCSISVLTTVHQITDRFPRDKPLPQRLPSLPHADLPANRLTKTHQIHRSILNNAPRLSAIHAAPTPAHQSRG